MTHEEIISAVESMTVLELADLVKAMEEKFGVSAAAPVAVVGGGAVDPNAGGDVQTEFDVILKGFDAAAKIKVIKAVRTVRDDLSLGDAKAFVESAPKPVKEAVSKEEAEKIAATLREAGAEVEIK